MAKKEDSSEEAPMKNEGGRIGQSEVDQLMQKYRERLDSQLNVSRQQLSESEDEEGTASREYSDFKKEYMPTHLSFYEKACNLSESVMKISPDKKKLQEYQEAIEVCHLNITPTGAVSFAFLAAISVIVFGGLASFAIFSSVFFIIFFLAVGALLIQPLSTLPMFLSTQWRMKSSNQMVICIFYIVTYMRHTSNLELAIKFASDHLSAPLSLDLKKVLWDVETEKYESLKESLDTYLLSWKKWNMEFVEAFHLIESSLFESSEDRRLSLLDKSLSVILEETYEKMLHYAQDLKTPMTMLHMLGIIMPILGLVILPLMVSFVCEVRWYHLAAFYNLALPLGIYYLGKKILTTRPTGYGDTDISEEDPELKKYRNYIFKLGTAKVSVSPALIAITFGVIFLLIGISPLILHAFTSSTDFDIIWRADPGSDESKIGITNTLQDPTALFSLLGYLESQGCPVGEAGAEGLGDIVGPFGFGAALLSLFFIIGLGVSIGLYFKHKSSNVIKIREDAKKLEKEFASALFQLGNRLGDGLPAEIAFGKVAEVMEESISGNFFRIVTSNITRLGMSVEQAIFDPKIGALVNYPSNVIESSMKVLIESSKKGPLIAAQALISISDYIKEIHRVDERLKDLLSETISSMKSQITFMTPAIAGIVIGITSMISGIIGNLGIQLRSLGSGGAAGAGLGNMTDILSMFGEGVPTFYFQIIVGVYVVEIIFILTIIVNGIENGADSLNEKYLLGVNMVRSTISYVLISLGVMLVFNLVAGRILSGFLSGGGVS